MGGTLLSICRRTMTVETLFHVTDAANVDSILSDGLRSDDRGMEGGYVFLTDTVEEAEHIGDVYGHHIGDPVVLEVEVLEHKLEDDPDPHGDLTSFAHRGDIPAHDVEVVSK